MTPCTPAPPCDTEYPLLCEPLETTSNGKRLIVEDSAACQKTIQTPTTQQILKADSSGNLTWTNGAAGTILKKDYSGFIEFASLNAILQSGPIDLGSQPLTTTGAITAATLISTGEASLSSATISGSITANGVITTTGEIAINRFDTTNEGGQVTFKRAVDNVTGWYIDCYGATTSPSLRIASSSGVKATIDGSGNFGIGTETPSKTLHVNGTVRIQALPQYPNNVDAIAGGLTADDVYKTGTGELRIVV